MNAFIKLLIVAMGVHSGIICAQSTAAVGGTILDKSWLPIAHLTISLDPGEYTATTNTDGYFQFYRLPEGRYTASITGVGYKSLQHKFSVADGKPVALNLRMEAFANNMSEVIVTGRTAVQEVNRQAFTVTAIDAKQLYNTTLDLAGALDRVSGVRVRESGGVGSNFNLSLNGFSGNHVKYFIDGIPMDGFGTSFQINNIPINAAERIEVYKGVVPVWLGSDALGGAINIVTGDRYKNYLDVSYSYGSFNTHRTVLNTAITSKKGLTLQVNAFQNYSDNNYKVKVDAADIYTGAYAPGVRVRRFHDTYHNETVIANVGVVQKKYADKLLFGITLGKNYKEIQTGARMVSVFGGWHRRGNLLMPAFKYRKTNLIKGLDLTINANYNFGSEQNIDTVNARFDWFGNSKPNGSSGERSRSLYKYKNNNGLFTAALNYRITDRQSLALSNIFNTFNRKGADELNPNTIDPPRKTQKNVLGLGYTYAVENRWNITGFAKFITQKNLISAAAAKAVTNKLGYGLAATWFFTQQLQIKASYELTNRMPEAQELFGDVENQEGNPNLKPERSNNINLGLSYRFAIDSVHRFMLTAGAVYRHSDNFIYNRLNNNQSRLVADNREGVRTLGADGEIRYSYKNWLSAGATLTYQFLQNMQQYEPGYTGESPVYLDQMPNIPYFFGNGDIAVTIPDMGRKGNRLSIGYHLLYVHDFYLYWPSRGGEKLTIPQQLSHDINIVYSIRNGRYNIGIEGRNLTDALLYDNFSLQKPSRGFYFNLRYFIH
jgi:outer membrane receptor protein involved in Fe transport